MNVAVRGLCLDLSPGSIRYWAYLLQAFLQAQAFKPGQVTVPALQDDHVKHFRSQELQRKLADLEASTDFLTPEQLQELQKGLAQDEKRLEKSGKTFYP